MIEWGGWKFDEISAVVVEPAPVVLTWGEGRLFRALLAAEGRVVDQFALISATSSKNRQALYALVASASRKLRDARLSVPVSKHNSGYRIPPAPEDPRRVRVAAILVEQFEATGPHARAAAKMIAEVYS